MPLYHTSGIWQRRCWRATLILTYWDLAAFRRQVTSRRLSLSWARAPASCELVFMQISEFGRCRALVVSTSGFGSFRCIRMTTRTEDGMDQSSCFFSRQHSSYIGMWKARPFHIATCRRESSLWWLSCKAFRFRPAPRPSRKDPPLSLRLRKRRSSDNHLYKARKA